MSQTTSQTIKTQYLITKRKQLIKKVKKWDRRQSKNRRYFITEKKNMLKFQQTLLKKDDSVGGNIHSDNGDPDNVHYENYAEKDQHN